MNKSKLLNFINKYSLNGLCNTVRWTSKNRGLITNFITDDKGALGMVAVKGINFPDGEFGIYNTKGLVKILGAMQTEVDVIATPESIDFKDESITAKFMLAKLDIIPEPPSTQNIPEGEFEFEINSVFIDTFLKSKSALEDSTNFAFSTSLDGKVILILNYAAHNTDRITIATNVDHQIDSPLLFSAEVLKEILAANKDCTSGKIVVSSAGILICQFQAEDIASKYYLVMLES